MLDRLVWAATVGLMMAALVLAVYLLASAQHGQDSLWMGACCGERDCWRVPVAVLDAAEGLVYVKDRQVTIDPAKIRRSQDGNTYWCAYWGVHPLTDAPTDATIRCVFYTDGS